MAPYWWLLDLHWIPAAGTWHLPHIAQHFQLTHEMDKNPELCLPRAEVTSTNGTQVYTEDACLLQRHSQNVKPQGPQYHKSGFLDSSLVTGCICADLLPAAVRPSLAHSLFSLSG